MEREFYLKHLGCGNFGRGSGKLVLARHLTLVMCMRVCVCVRVCRRRLKELYKELNSLEVEESSIRHKY
jgi:hypothetical protein